MNQSSELRVDTIAVSVCPHISVVIPTCHRNDMLALCLDCLAPGVQTLPADQYEVIVTDDGLRTTAEETVASRYPWAKWVAGPRKGPAANRNNGARLAVGEWLAFTDDDCLPSPGWLEGYGKAIMPGVSVYEGKTVCSAGIHSPLESAPLNETGGFLWSCNMMISPECFREMGGFDENLPYPNMEDTDFRERLKAKKYRIDFITTALVDHPPRRLAWGGRLAATHESAVQYWYKQGHRSSYAGQLIYWIIRFRLAAIKNYRLSRDTFLAFGSLLMELIYVLRKIGYWQRKYRSVYGVNPASDRKVEN